MDDASVLVKLVEAYSPSGSESAAVRTFNRLAEGLGFRTEVDAVGNGIARIGSGRPQILFLGHIDTVEGELPIRVEHRRVTGRGTCDAKGALAAALIAGSRHRGPGEIVIVAAVGEEADSRGARYLIPRESPDYLVVGEPSGASNVTIGYKGSLEVALTFEGERAHLSAPTPTTVENAISVVSELRGYVADRGGTTPFSSLAAKLHSMQTIREGGRELVEARMNFRLPPSVRSEEVIRLLEAGRITHRIIDRSEAVEVEPTNPVVRAIVSGIRDLDLRPALVRKTGTSDMNLAVPVWGCPAAAYGPGDSHLDHTDEEALDLSEFERAISVLTFAFRKISAATDQTLRSIRSGQTAA